VPGISFSVPCIYLNFGHRIRETIVVHLQLTNLWSSNIPSLVLVCDNEKNFVHKYWKHGPFLSNVLTNCFIISSLMCKGGSRIFSRSTRLKFETFWILVAIAPFRINVKYPNVCPWPCYPTRIGNREILCSLFVVPPAIQ
jgi:hypothetical protein